MPGRSLALCKADEILYAMMYKWFLNDVVSHIHFGILGVVLEFEFTLEVSMLQSAWTKTIVACRVRRLNVKLFQYNIIAYLSSVSPFAGTFLIFTWEK